MKFDNDLRLEKQRNFLIKTGYFSVVALMILFVLKFIAPTLMPFIIAFLISCILNYPIRFILKKIPLKRSFVSILMVILFFIFSTIIIVSIGVETAIFIKNSFSNLPVLFTEMFIPFIEDIFTKVDRLINSLDSEVILFLEQGLLEVFKSLGTFISNLSTAVIGRFSHIATSIPGTLIRVLITIIATFFITIDFDKIIMFIKKQIPQRITVILEESRTYIFGTIFKCILSYILIMLITFTEIFIGLSIIGIENAAIIAFIISLFDILPVLGSGGVMIPWAIIAGISGNYKVSIGIALLYVGITIIRNIIEPKLVGKQVGLHPIVTLAAMLIGVKLFGMIGLLGLAISIALIKSLNYKGVINIFKKEST